MIMQRFAHLKEREEILLFWNR